jgi:integrase
VLLDPETPAMRRPEPYYKKSHKCWYANINGKATRLDPDEETAWKVYFRLMGSEREADDDAIVLDLINEFLDHSKLANKARTYEWYAGHLESFSDFIEKGTKTKGLRVSSLRPFHVTDWIEAEYPRTKNGNNTIHNAMRCVQRVMNWAEKSGRILKSPLKGLQKPPATSRDVYITPEQFDQIMEIVTDKPFRDFLTILRQTGCRPQEARLVEARHFDKTNKCWVFPKEEAKGGKEERVILLNDVALEITERLVKKNPTGPIFRNKIGNPWDTKSLKCRCTRLTKKLGFRVIPYGLRHAFATEAIVRGVDLITLSRLMGHKDLRMLQQTYTHVHKRSDHLRAGLRKATGGDETPVSAS